jgi:hypothetical protein
VSEGTQFEFCFEFCVLRALRPDLRCRVDHQNRVQQYDAPVGASKAIDTLPSKSETATL